MHAADITRRTLLLAAAAFASAPLPTHAQSGTALRFVVGTPAGASIDVYARTVSEHIGAVLGRPTVVINRPGASGSLAAQMVAEAPPDGNMIWVGSAGASEISPLVFANLKWSMRDFQPLIKGVEAPLVLVAHPSSGVRDFDGLLAWARARRGQLAFASYSQGTASHFLGSQLSAKLDLDLRHVAYQGSAPQVNDLVAGHVPIGFTQVETSLPFIESGGLIAVATTGAERFRALQHIPTLKELGHDDLQATIWFGLLVRAGTPKEVGETFLRAAIAAHADARVRGRLESLGFAVPAVVGNDFARAIAEGSARWERVIKATNFKLNE